VRLDAAGPVARLERRWAAGYARGWETGRSTLDAGPDVVVAGCGGQSRGGEQLGGEELAPEREESVTKVDERATARVAPSPIFLWRREGHDPAAAPSSILLRDCRPGRKLGLGGICLPYPDNWFRV